MSGNREDTDLIVVAMPLYGHAALVLEAIESVLASKLSGCSVAVVVSVDGDPRQETFDQLLLYAAAHPAVHVLFGANAGPGGARNRAIEYVLANLPEAEAVYFLDADNRVLPGTIETLYRQLRTSGCGWIYTNIDTFSVSWRAHYGNRYSRLLHCITDNICDTGSMISLDVFRAGVRFDADRQNGFEDWEFWLSCIEHGFVGEPCHDTTFEYRLRAESRFKEANRDRAASVSFLRKRHRALFQRPMLVDFEHEECPRYLFARTEDAAISYFTDPTKAPKRLRLDDIIPAFWASVGEPDNVHFPPFLIAGSGATLDLLLRSRMLPNVLSHLERLSEKANVVFVQLGNDAAQRKIEPVFLEAGAQHNASPDLIFLSTSLVRDVIQNKALDWFASIGNQQVWPTSAILKVRFPFPRSLPRRLLITPQQVMINCVNAIATSPLRRTAGKRWTWRPARLVPYSDLHKALRQEVGGSPILPLGHSEGGRKTAALLVPNASFGGAEKVVYAASRELKAAGYETHLFVLGTSRMDVIDEFDQSFDYIHFWDQGIPAWGGSGSFLGHDFIAEGHDVDWAALKGQLSGFDLVINNHVMAVHPLIARLRSEGTRTACYLHVVDNTAFKRPAGQPFAAIAHEHCYDAFLTCSEQLKLYLHSFGVPHEKIFAVPNGASFSVPPKVLSEVLSVRRIERKDDRLRVLYMGRLDQQKGIDRLAAAIAELRASRVPFDARAVGGEILADATISWTDRLRDLGVEVGSPVFASKDLIKALGWADVLLMPSRWEGAPLMIAEAQQLGCVPIATAVGAVDELITDGEDGILIEAAADPQVVRDMAKAIEEVALNRERLAPLMEGCLRTAARRSWGSSFSEFLGWCDRSVHNSSLSRATVIRGREASNPGVAAVG
ncbi:glycosyltransferase [Sinorhizobium medicae]|jgi:glycosyltransferase involved in cell wall biosynthesis|uniref:glycosyltransferase n=1 Tax=Sinorhizobium medicae TaxID=110321 RepID=UPI000C7DFE34|nr:glycosyltransferase [Sinorhizobium medicae]MDX0529441.1 glycosyltransferase [Sinorhizobium medicae]MDX0560612.1 glycosyltransferase [Sinorhizobium medicae]MDX0868280.1 glycosyltransferase [Sinorhizobium medicae]MDX0893792.1 glycosyltransferase [Sinorhizobium medicae]MDX0924019.1 glycosyltransferase [Sinorhizobium medicae]